VRRLACPECSAESLQLELFSGLRRRRERTCPQCGSPVEIVVPGIPYYAVTVGFGLVGSVIGTFWLVLAFMGQWYWLAAMIVLSLAISMCGDLYLKHITVAHSLVDRHEKAARAAGRWYPD